MLDELARLHFDRQGAELFPRSRAMVAPPRRGGLTPHVRRAVLDYLAAHFAHGLTVADVARAAGLAPSYFLRASREELGTTPHQHPLALGVTAAEQMLLDTERSISTIAMDTGFSSQSHMTTTFTKPRVRTAGSCRRRLAGSP